MECRIAQCDEIYSFEIFNTYELFRLSSLDATKPKQICQTNSMARLSDHWVFKFGFDSTNSLELKQYLEKSIVSASHLSAYQFFLFCSVLFCHAAAFMHINIYFLTMCGRTYSCKYSYSFLLSVFGFCFL